MSKQIKGKQRECFFSYKFHSYKGNTPFLISPLFLRRYGAGQVDIGVIRGQSIILYEVKSSGRISWQQKIRLNRTCELLSSLLNLPAFWKMVR